MAETQGGRLELAPPKRGVWYVEPKLNGMARAHSDADGYDVESARALLTIADCFRPRRRWRGSLIKDSFGLIAKRWSAGTISVAARLSCSMWLGSLGRRSDQQRRAMLESLVPTDAVFSGDTSRLVSSGTAVLIATMRADSYPDALAFYLA